eukprot:1394158-Amorphochlora_amoeboformis.AAC.1
MQTRKAYATKAKPSLKFSQALFNSKNFRMFPIRDFACKVGQVLLDNVGNHTRSTSQSEQFEWFTRDFYSSNAKPGKATGKTTGKETGKATGKAAGKGTAEDEVECPVYEGESRIPFGTPSFWFYAGISLGETRF